MKCMTFCNSAWSRRSPRPLWEPKSPISAKIRSQSQIKPDVHYLNRLGHLKWYFKKPEAAPTQININRNQWGAMEEIQTAWILPKWIDHISKKNQNICFSPSDLPLGDLISQWFSSTWAMPVILGLERQGGRAAPQSLLQVLMSYTAASLKS